MRNNQLLWKKYISFVGTPYYNFSQQFNRHKLVHIRQNNYCITFYDLETRQAANSPSGGGRHLIYELNSPLHRGKTAEFSIIYEGFLKLSDSGRHRSCNKLLSSCICIIYRANAVRPQISEWCRSFGEDGFRKLKKRHVQ